MHIVKLLLLLIFALPAFAMDANEQLPDPAAEARARALFKQIRCVVCQAESIDESPALLAADMRNFVRANVMAGQNEGQILNALQMKYGDKVLMRPPMRTDTVMLWIMPALLLAFGGLVMWRAGKRA